MGSLSAVILLHQTIGQAILGRKINLYDFNEKGSLFSVALVQVAYDETMWLETQWIA